MKRGRFSLPILVLLTLAAGPPMVAGEPEDQPRPAVKSPADDEATAVPAAGEKALERARPRSEWGPHAESRIYGLAYVEEEDEPGNTRLRGVSLLWSNWDETVDFNGGLGWYLSWQDGDRQTIWGGGFEMTWLPWVPEAPVRFGPRLRLGLEHRASLPDDGLSGMAAAGLELGFWIGDHLQLALIADREWPFQADARTQFGISLRYSRRRY